MLIWVAVFFGIAIISGLLGFSGIASAASSIAKIIFYLFVALFIGSLIFYFFAV
ncbi:MAG: DUF1328 domain-containing protein [Gammaproteobacteria bacterium]